MKILKNLKSFQVVILIILLSFVAYGALITKMGFYTDDWTFNWAYQLFGSKGLFSYFSTNRPVWGLLFQLTMPLLGKNPLVWHIFGLFCRIIASLSFYWLCIELWPERKFLTSAAGLLFSLYPGFLMQPLALTFGHIWIIYSIFIVSLVITIKAIRNPSHRIAYTLISLSLSLINILCMEYFLPLEVIRLVIIFQLTPKNKRLVHRFFDTMLKWLPYFGILATVTIWRTFFFKKQTHIYSLQLVDTFKTSFSGGISQLWQEFLSGLYKSSIYVWVKPFVDFIQRQESTSKTTYLASIILSIAAALVLWVIFWKTINEPKGDVTHSRNLKWSGWVIAIIALLLAGIPFYLTGLQIGLESFASRFTLPFIFGASLFFALILELIPFHWLRTGLLSLILTVSFGTHIFNANEFRWMTVENENLMYQLSWRAPGLKPNTLIVTNDVSTSFTYTTLKAELNLIYSTNKNNNFGWIFARDLAQKYPEINSQTVIEIPALVNNYHGVGEDIVVFIYRKGECLRFIDLNSSYLTSDILENGFHLVSNPYNLIYDGNDNAQLDASLLINDPYMNWCYYFEKADLALQLNEYDSIQSLYEEVINEDLQPSNGIEWYPFIEGLAAAEAFQDAINVSQKVIAINPESEEYLSHICAIWDRVAASTEFGSVIAEAKLELGCP